MSSIFTKIINGEIASVKVHEDDLTLAIMDINPVQPGQILVFPKREVGTIWDLDQPDYLALMAVVQNAGRSLRKAFPDKARIGVMVEGLEVADHAHVKVFPFSTIEEYHAVPDEHFRPTTHQLEELAVKLSF